MRYLSITFITLALCGIALTSQAATEATTTNGRTVILNEDGTWRYQSADPISDSLSRSRPAGSYRIVKSNKGFVKVRYDTNKWVFKRRPAGSTSEFSFKHVRGDGYAITIIERISVPIENLKRIALSNAKNAAPNARITHERVRTVYGKKVVEMGIRGTIQGIPFQYLGYYWSGKSGSIQLITYTAQNLFSEYKADFKKLLNGLMISGR